jgi:hypothetical protein
MGMDETNTHYIFRKRWLAEVPAEGAVPPVVVPAVVVHPDIHAVLVICGFANVLD